MMKRRVLCVFSLIAYLLAACFIFSGFIAQQMTVPVTANTYRASTETGFDTSISLRYCFDGGYPTDVMQWYLGEVREGTGWQSGLRCYTMRDLNINPQTECVELRSSRAHTFITAAARDPQEGELVKIVEPETVADMILYTYSTSYGIPDLTGLPANLQVTAQSDSALLISSSRGTRPFFSNHARNLHDSLAHSDEAHSLTEAEEFLSQLPRVAMVFALLMLGVEFWAFGCCQKMVWVNTLSAGITLAAMALILSRIDLPASLLPSGNILDAAHYIEEFSLMFDSLRELGLSDHSLFQTAAQVKSYCIWILCGYGAGSICLILAKLIKSDKTR